MGSRPTSRKGTGDDRVEDADSSSSNGKPRRRAKVPAGDPGSVDTPAAIIEAAESLFIEKGFAGTSLRAIAARAGVNLASAHYHFGSKAGLLGAVIHLRVAPANEERAKRLDELQRASADPTVQQILEAFFSPLVDRDVSDVLARLIARLYGEPESVSQPLIEQEFGPIMRRFLAALATALPDVDEEIIAWRFYFIIGAMIHHLAFGSPPSLEPASPSDPRGVARLLEFALAGMTNGATRRAPEEES